MTVQITRWKPGPMPFMLLPSVSLQVMRHMLTKLGACKPSGEQNGKCFLPHARPTTRPILPTLREQIEKHLKIL